MNSLITEYCAMKLFEKPTVFIDARTDQNKMFIARLDWDERKVHITYVSKYSHATNALQVASGFIKPLDGTEGIYVFISERTSSKTKVKVVEITQFKFISSLLWNDGHYRKWNSIFEALGIEH